MKKLISLILVVLLLCMALPAFAEEDVTGDWYLKTMKMGDQEYDAASIGYAITMTLNADGTVAMAMPGEESTTGTWAWDGDNKFTMTIDDTTTEGTVSEDAIIISSDGGEMIFTREVVEAITLAEVKAAETAEEFYGDWSCEYMEMDGVVMGIAGVGMGAPVMTLSEAGVTFAGDDDDLLAAALNLNKMDAPVFAEGKLTLNAAADALNTGFSMTAELLEDGMLKLTAVSNDSPMILYFTPTVPAEGAGEGWLYEGSSFSIKTDDLPQGYVCLPYEQFEAGYKALVDGTLTQSSTYEDVAAAFGAEGIRMAGIQYEGYAYYSWYSDRDYIRDTKIHVLVTFKVKDETLTYYAYSSLGIMFTDVM